MMPTHATKLTNASKMKTLALDDVRGYDDDVLGLLGLTSRRKSKIPLDLGLLGCLQSQFPSFFLVKISDILFPLDGVTTSIYGI
jgi:hypothetical protein